MKKSFSIYKLCIAIVLVLIFVANPVTYGQAAAATGKIPDEIYFLLQMENFLKTNYVNDIDDLELLRGAIKGMVEALDDPYSEYYIPVNSKNLLNQPVVILGALVL